MHNIFTGAKRSVWLLSIYFIFSAGIRAGEPADYDYIATASFWRELYPTGGWSLYCGYRFSLAQKTIGGRAIGIEHIFSTARMAAAAGCHNRMQCRESKNPRFMRMEADLHNMYPAWQTVIIHLIDFRYGLVSGENWRFDDCDLEWQHDIVEPRKIARGNIARAMLYMFSHYAIPADRQSLALFRQWNRLDPPSRQEKIRNNIIERIQGNRNPYIDNPALAEKQLTLRQWAK